MKSYDKKLLALLAAVSCLYGGFRLYDGMQAHRGTDPAIQAPQDTASFSVKAPMDLLTQGVTASDAEDGDLTGRVFVESLSPMDEKGQRTATYGVFDSDDNIARTSRSIQYTDYAPPRFTLREPLIFSDEPDDSNVFQRIAVSSVLDGDLSDRIVLEDAQEKAGIFDARFSVRDSAGIESQISLNVSMLQNEPSYQIELSQYLVYAAPGTPIDPRSYLRSITMMTMDYSDLLDEVEIRTDYDPNKPGMYEFLYQLQRPNGDFGTTKLVVIVE